MKVLTKPDDAKRLCMDQKSFALGHFKKEIAPVSMHTHRCLEIYFLVSGGRTFCISDRNYRMEPGNLFFINQYEPHQVSQQDPSGTYERFVIYIHPEYLERLSTGQTNLCQCFTHRTDRFSNRLPLTDKQQRRFLYFINKLASIRGDRYGGDIAERSAFSDFMLFINKAVMESEQDGSSHGPEAQFFNTKVADILPYIEQNLDSPLSIGSIAAHFYLSSSYLCRLFKKTTGMTINYYITMRRIETAKTLLSEGLSVSEVCGLCGFNDYSNFFKAFTKQVGISPKKYSQNSLS